MLSAVEPKVAAGKHLACSSNQFAFPNPSIMHHHDSNDDFLIRIELEEPEPGYLVFTFLRDRRGRDFMILLAKCENREELNRDALIDTIADAYLEQPGEAARLGRHTVVSALMQCLQLPNPL